MGTMILTKKIITESFIFNAYRPQIISKAGGKRDLLTGQRRNKAVNVSFSNKRSRKWQQVNLQTKKIFWPEGKRFVKIRVSARTIRTVEKKGLVSLTKEAGIDPWKLAFEDVRPDRLEYLSENAMQVPRPKNQKNKMKNPERFATSTKSPISPCYVDGCILWVRDGEADKIYGQILAQKEADLAAQ